MLKWISGPELTKRINDFTDWFVGGVDTFTIWLKDHVTEWVINPLQDLMAQSPWWVMALVLLARRLRARRLAPDRDHRGVRGRHPRHRALERHDGHPGDDPDRHRCW